MLVAIEKSVVEGAGAAGLAAMLGDPERFAGKKVGTILCGGNIDTHLLANVLVRDLVRCGRIARLRVAAQDRPGALAAITAKFHEAGVNIIEINHSRIFTRLPAKDTVIEVECEARDAEAIDDVVKRLESAGFHVERALARLRSETSQDLSLSETGTALTLFSRAPNSFHRRLPVA